jgi:hypothetical protein
VVSVLAVFEEQRLKEESPATFADEPFAERRETELPVHFDRPTRLPRRHLRKKFRKLTSANRDKPLQREARFELTPPPRGAEPEFCSRSEAICAELLRRFVPAFELRKGLTFQVAIGSDGRGNTYSVDFLVDGVLLEYHPVRFYRNKKGFGDFRDSEEYRSYTRAIHALKGESRRFFHDAMEMRLKENYFKRRRALLDQHPLFRRMELVVATSPEDLYSLVIKRFGQNYPSSVDAFKRLFDEINRSLP